MIFISGCVGFEDPFGFISPKTEVKEQPPDVISIQNINVLPPSPVIAGDQFSVSFELSNVEEERDVNVDYKLMDDGLCSLESGVDSETFEDFVPGRVEFVEWTFNSPSNEEIGYLRTTCPIRFIIGYQFTAISDIEANVITENRYLQLQQSGEFATFKPTLNVGRGPIKIYIDYGASLPIRTERVLPVYITVQDKGTGLLKEVPQNALKIIIPEGFGLAEDSNSCGERFTCNGSSCSNTEDSLTMIKRESPTIKCSFTTPNEGNVVLERTYFITASLDYGYNLTQKIDVEVQPLEA